MFNEAVTKVNRECLSLVSGVNGDLSWFGGNLRDPLQLPVRVQANVCEPSSLQFLFEFLRA